MTSNINSNHPMHGSPSTAAVRENFEAARIEIESAQEAINELFEITPIGGIGDFPVGFTPANYLACEGQEISLLDYANLDILPVVSYGSTWETRSFPHRCRLHAACFNGTRLMVASEQSRLYSTTNGRDWTTHDMGVGQAVRDLTWKFGKFHGPTTFGRIAQTVEGASWVLQATGLNDSFHAICDTGENLVVVGAAGKIAVSNDGSAWVLPSSGTTAALVSVATNTTGVVVATRNDAGLIYSLDHGLTWAPCTGTTSTFLAICHTGAKFIATGWSGTVAHSVNGSAWTDIASTKYKTCEGIYNVEGALYRSSSLGLIEISTDAGYTWAPIANTEVGQVGKRIAFAFDRLWLPGPFGQLLSSPTQSSGNRVIPYIAPKDGRHKCIRAI